MHKCRKPYTFGRFCLDVFFTCITGGFYAIWIFCREMRNR